MIDRDLLLYVSDDGHVRFADQENPSLYLVEPVMPTGMTVNPNAETWQELAESIHLTYTERRYRLQKIRFPSVAERNLTQVWIGEDRERLKLIWERARRRTDEWNERPNDAG